MRQGATIGPEGESQSPCSDGLVNTLPGNLWAMRERDTHQVERPTTSWSGRELTIELTPSPALFADVREPNESATKRGATSLVRGKHDTLDDTLTGTIADMRRGPIKSADQQANSLITDKGDRLDDTFSDTVAEMRRGTTDSNTQLPGEIPLQVSSITKVNTLVNTPSGTVSGMRSHKHHPQFHPVGRAAPLRRGPTDRRGNRRPDQRPWRRRRLRHPAPGPSGLPAASPPVGTGDRHRQRGAP